MRDGEFIGLGDNGLFVRFNIKNKKFASFQVRNESRNGISIKMLTKTAGNDLLMGSHHINMQLFKINISDSRSVSSLNKISSYSGQINCGVSCGDKFYFASYVKAVFYSMDTAQPFEYGKNPVVIGEIGKEQNRPIAMVSDGKFVYIATGANYGKLGGAISVFNPESGEINAYRDFVPFQNPNSMFYHPASGGLVGTTTIHADCGTSDPKADSAVVYVWHAGKTEHTSAPWKTSSLNAFDLSPAGRLIGFGGNKLYRFEAGTDGNKYYLFDLSSKKYVVRDWPYQEVRCGIFMDERCFYGATSDFIFRLDIETDKMFKLENAHAASLFQKISEREIVFVVEGHIVKKLTIN
ncbi:MAG: hypothetical protein PHW60_07880 [Kiritimatiellae bacterium]|nr:hypothetical protein [Kiritimatiellia bacterium]